MAQPEAVLATKPPTVVKAEIPHKLAFLLEMHPYKVAYGGRHGLKTRSFATALLILGANQKLRILCCREIMTSIKDSVHQELKIAIETLGLGGFYTVFDTEIRGRNGTTFIYSGLAGHSVESIKSFASIDVVWIEEAQTVKKRSWEILLPTIRAINSEIWVSFNPDMDSDDTYQRFVVNPPPGTKSIKMGWQDAEEMERREPGRGWWPAAQEAKRLHSLKFDADYENTWEGKCRTVIAGAIYAREIGQMYEDRRIRGVPYDPRFPVHCVWDLGWNDAMAIVMVQKTSPSSLNVINYMEDSFRTYAEYKADLDALGYAWGDDWLPHDAENKDPKSGTNAKQVLQRLGRKKVKIMARTSPKARIDAARMMFPRIYIDDTERTRATGFLGGSRLIDCLKRYRRNVPLTTGEPGEPVHDAYSHACDAFGGLAEIVDQIRNEGDIPPPPMLPAFVNRNRGMGTLGG